MPRRRLPGWLMVRLPGTWLALLLLLSGCRPEGLRTVGEGLVLEPGLPLPADTLLDTDGLPWPIAAKVAGKPTLLFLGYTHCPDVCPVTMANIAQALAHSSPEVRRAITVVLITTDPRRDTPEVLRNWLDRFDRSFIGLTGDSALIADLSRRLRLGIPVLPSERPDTGYTVGHSATVLGFSRDGLAHVAYPFGVRQADWVRNLERLVNP